MRFIILALFLVTACQSVFYYPTDHEYLPAEKIPYKNKRFWLKSAGLPDLAAWHLETTAGSRKGVVLQFHGNAENMTSHIVAAEWFLRAGFDVVTFDYRGYGKSHGKMKRAGATEDGLRALRYVTQNFPSTPLIVLGQSLGGAIALSSVASYEEQQHISLFILDSTFTSYRSIVRRKLSEFFLTWPLQHPLSWIIDDKNSPREYALRIFVPTLWIHDLYDPVVPYEEGFALLRYLPRSTAIAILKQGGHGSCFTVAPCEGQEKFLNFWENHRAAP